MNEKNTRRLVFLRSGGLCERCGRQGHTYHHRKNRSAGGGWDCANIVFLCGDGTRGCHGWVTTHPALAAEEGFHVKPWEDPAAIPILLHRRLTRHLTWDTSDYDNTRQTVETPPPVTDVRTENDDRTAPGNRGWNPDW